MRHRSAEHIRRGPCCLATSQCSRRRVPPSVRVFSQASPAAKMLSTDVRRQLPHVIPPVAPIRSPAYLASTTSGTAPAATRPFRPAAAASTPYAPWPRGLVLRTLGARRRRPTRCRAWSAAPRRSVPQEPVAALQRQRFLHHEGDALAHLGERRRELGAQTRPADDHDVIILALQRSRRIEEHSRVCGGGASVRVESRRRAAAGRSRQLPRALPRSAARRPTLACGGMAVSRRIALVFVTSSTSCAA